MCKGILLGCLPTFPFKDTAISCTPLRKHQEGRALQQYLLHQLKPQKSHLNVGKHLLIRRLMKYWNRLPRQVVESPSVEMLKSQLDTVLGSLVQLALLVQWGQTKWSQDVPSKPNSSVIHSTSQDSAFLKLGIVQQFSQKVMEYGKSSLRKDPPFKIHLKEKSRKKNPTPK